MSWCFEISISLGDMEQNDNDITCHITGIIEKPEKDGIDLLNERVTE